MTPRDKERAGRRLTVKRRPLYAGSSLCPLSLAVFPDILHHFWLVARCIRQAELGADQQQRKSRAGAGRGNSFHLHSELVT